MSTKLGEFFTLEEFTRSNAAAAANVPNVPTEAHIAAMRLLVAHVLDPLRRLLGPIKVTSGYRSKAVNDELRKRGKNASRTSQHMEGEAADIVVPGFSPKQVATALVKAGIPFDQVIWYDGGWVHVSYTAKRANRGEVLHSPASGGYVESVLV